MNVKKISATIPEDLLDKAAMARPDLKLSQILTESLRLWLSAYAPWQICFSQRDDDSSQIRVTVVRDGQTIFDFFPGHRYTFGGSRMSLDVSGRGQINKHVVSTWIKNFPIRAFFEGGQYPLTQPVSGGEMVFAANLGVTEVEARNYLHQVADMITQLRVLSLRDLPGDNRFGANPIVCEVVFAPPGERPLIVYYDSTGKEHTVMVSSVVAEQGRHLPTGDRTSG